MKFDEKGFSLIEILLAVSIVGMIAAAAVPKAAHVLAVSRTQRVISDLQTLDAAVVMYETEHGTQPGSLNDLSDYVQNGTKIKPPGKAILGTGAEVEANEYLLQKSGSGKDMRATFGGHTAEEFLPSGTNAGDKT